MKRNDSRIIVNLNLTDDELQERVHKAIEEYIERYLETDKCREQIENKTYSIVQRRLKEYDTYYSPTVFKVGEKDKLTLRRAINELVDKMLVDYLNSGTIAKAIVKKLTQMFAEEEKEK